MRGHDSSQNPEAEGQKLAMKSLTIKQILLKLPGEITIRDDGDDDDDDDDDKKVLTQYS